MGFSEDLKADIEKIFHDKWDQRDGYNIPTVDSLGLGNDAVDLKLATVLYADMADSTDLVMKHKPFFAAEVYKAYLLTCARIVRKNGGQITAYDGDRIMAVYDSVSCETDAVKTAMQIKYAVSEYINPAIKQEYPDTSFVLQQSVGIDTSDIRVARIGIRNNNDLVWVGRAPNYAAKLCALRDEPYTTWITGDIYDSLEDTARVSKGKNMWEEYVWKARGNLRIFRSHYKWKV